MEFQIEHFSHPEHPLSLLDLKDKEVVGLVETQRKMKQEKARRSESSSDEEEYEVDGSITCNFCSNVLESSYSCISCDFHLHKLCAKLPAEMIHPDHDPQHILTLVSSNSEGSPDGGFTCNICSEVKHGFSYNCHSCDFCVDVRCASEVQEINHKGHRHLLRPFLSTAYFRCKACATIHSASVSYKCNRCPFWAHEDCATLPTIVKYRGHVHPLSLIVPPRSSSFLHYNCMICKMETTEKDWLYECDGCGHLVHVNCLTTSLIKKRSSMYEVDASIDLTKLFRLPLSFQYDDLVDQMIQHMAVYYGNNRKKKVVSQVRPLKHFGHKHPLTLCNIGSDKEFFDSVDGEKKKYKICNACVLPVSTPVYFSCTTCNNYILHEWCAKLPNELQHPSHKHSLILTGPDHKDFGSTQCPACESYSNGFVYKCKKPKCFRFAMDIKCLLPPAISHKYHQHPLKLRMNCSDEGCVACDRPSSELAYGCDQCCFYLHYSCALQPITIVHRYDEHPFVLIDAPIEDGQDEYACEFCEEDIKPEWWFYHCLLCDLSACADCIFKKERGKGHFNHHLSYSSEIHDHPLTIVGVDHTNKSSLCSTCSHGFSAFKYALQCAECNIMFHSETCTGALLGDPIPLVSLEESN